MIHLTQADRKSLIRLLGKLQARLEDSIKCAEPVAGPDSPGYLLGEQELLDLDRRDWSAAEKWVKRLEVA